jgi:hypothetical protein
MPTNHGCAGSSITSTSDPSGHVTENANPAESCCER